MAPQALAIDFGTSNSAAAILRDGHVQRIAMEADADTLPTAVFFPADGGAMRIGRAATQALIAGHEGRYMRALKSVLGTALLHETRLIAGRRRSLAQVIAAFLSELRQRAEQATGLRFHRALSGRPVHFHSNDPQADLRAEADLRACYLAAGFDQVDFLPEPQAAALASHRLGADDSLGLIVDIGGGTSDFSVIRSGRTGVRILANHGIRLGGTDFDQLLSLSHAMPLLGHGGELRREMGPGLLPMPNGIYVDLANWARIPFLYAPEPRRMAADMARLAVHPHKLRRLVTVLRDELGHDLAFAVEHGKIAANGGEIAHISLDFIEPGLATSLGHETLAATLAGHRQQLQDAMSQTLQFARVDAADIGHVILVGGSSLMEMVASAAHEVCPQARLLRSDAFTAVIDGLAIATAS
ncbi:MULTISPECIES: Hsp70 family protein [unclassified Paracoccus (in: a-proteobacteria)]|uniref:Hsp70 family protein n=1 Tax=unclassified Paracoccus (in: a-proteobacteria) TaxID=2688777 RepID=UPI0012B414EC|nr:MULTISPECIES: Hsp70 family protein [unclassified Paracoccus (in: a-proteobacteria)]UXU76483.1 Hsp70 family protein [Paracoccus sp. SMMA_5]UXU82179.1 Hsp70 family protein [Paracoccus sp. SMMA_5_TC]